MADISDRSAAGDARAALERELYWAEDVTRRTNSSTQDIRVALHEFAAVMKADERAVIPRDEPQLGSSRRWRRRLKGGMFFFLRPVMHRYDRLLGELAMLNRMLADRLADAEAEIERLRGIVEGREARREEDG
ncbi:MAG TPA: hypothetical protein VGA93_08215 [Actinomycetota bacterium]